LFNFCTQLLTPGINTMFNTEFTCVNNTYRLVVDSTLAIPTAAWLESQGVVFDRYFKHEGFCKFIFITAPDKAIALISAKYPLPVETPVAKELGKPLYMFLVSYSSGEPRYWIECQSNEEAWKLAVEMRQPFIHLSCIVGLSVNGNTVSLIPDGDALSALIDRLMTDLISKLGFGDPVVTDKEQNPERASVVTGHNPYYFADCYTPASIKAKYRKLSKIHHPDCGGDSETFTAIANQYQEAMTSLS
jgi:hypothetical protein